MAWKRHPLSATAVIILAAFFLVMVIIGLTDGPTPPAPFRTINISTHAPAAPTPTTLPPAPPPTR